MTNRQTQIYAALATNSRRAIKRTVARNGKPYDYTPRGDLLVRLAIQFSMSKQQVYIELLAIRAYLLSR